MAVYNTNGCSVTFKLNSASGAAPAFVGLSEAVPNLVMETVDVTEIGDVDRQIVPGIKSGNASINLFYDALTHAALATAWNDGALLEVGFIYLAGTTAPAPKSWTVDAYITSMSQPMMVNDVIRCNITLQFTGAITFA